MRLAGFVVTYQLIRMAALTLQGRRTGQQATRSFFGRSGQRARPEPVATGWLQPLRQGLDWLTSLTHLSRLLG